MSGQPPVASRQNPMRLLNFTVGPDQPFIFKSSFDKTVKSTPFEESLL
ncbi:hypothetical protein [Povalibacter sp.]|nr:hypothetical protein [Povalibacter sp.]